MKCYWLPLLCAASMAINANAQKPAGTAETHVAAAKSAAGQDYSGVINLCNEPQPPTGQRAAPAGQQANAPATRTAPPASQWYAEPAKVFDNLYFVGSKDVSAWAVTTSEGIVLIDSLYEYSVEEEIANGLKKLAQVTTIPTARGGGNLNSQLRAKRRGWMPDRYVSTGLRPRLQSVAAPRLEG